MYTLLDRDGKGARVFTCRGCREVARLTGEVEGLRNIMESMKMMVMGQGVEEKGGETEFRVTRLEEDKKEKCEGEMPPYISTGEIRTEKETAGTTWTEEMDSGLQIEVEQGTKGEDKCRQEIDRKDMRTGMQILATQEYKKNLDSPVGEELDFKQGDTLVFVMEHEENKHWWLVDDGKGQVGYVSVAYLIEETLQEEESDTTRKEGHEKSTDGKKIGMEKGQDGVRRKSYSAAVIGGIKRNSTIYVGDCTVWKTDSTLNKDEDIVVCLPGARIEHVTERVQTIVGRGNGGTLLVHIRTNNTDKEGTTAIVKKYRNLLKKTKKARVGQIFLSGILTSVWNQEPMLQKFEEDGCQRDGEAAL